MALDGIPPLPQGMPIVNPDGSASAAFAQYWQQLFGNQSTINTDVTGKADASTQIIAGNGLTGGGNLSSNVTIDADEQAILDAIGSTRGSILYRGASGWAILTPGTSGHFLKSNGSGADPSYAAASGGSGALTYIGKTSVSGGATADVSLPNTYDSFYLEYYLTCATDAVDLRARFTTDNFTTVESGASAYRYSAERENSGEGTDRSDGAAYMTMTTNQGNAAGEFASGFLNIQNAKETAPTTLGGLTQYLNSANLFTATQHHGALVATSNVDGIRFYMSSGNETGWVKAWGRTAA